MLAPGARIAQGTRDAIRNNRQGIESYQGKTGTREGRRDPAQGAVAAGSTTTNGEHA